MMAPLLFTYRKIYCMFIQQFKQQRLLKCFTQKILQNENDTHSRFVFFFIQKLNNQEII